MKRLYVAISVGLLLTACVNRHARMNTMMNSWMGKGPDSLIASFGPPSKILDAEDGGRIYVFSATTVETSQDPTHAINVGSKNRPQYVFIGGGTSESSTTKYRMFWVKDSRVYKWAWQGY